MVTNWNLLMPCWQHSQMFQTAQHLGTFVTMLDIYIASTLLPGLSFDLVAGMLDFILGLHHLC